MNIISYIKKFVRLVFFPPNSLEFIVIKHNEQILLINKTTTALKLKYGIYEKAEFNYLRKNINSDDICLDIGANIGAYTIFFAKNARKVISFEPIKINKLMIEFSAELNSLDNIKIEQIALNDFNGNSEFLVVNESILSGLVSYDIENQKKYLREHYSAEINKVITVKCKKLDDYNFNKIDIVKIDVEGGELKVINGAINTIKNCKPRLIIIECEDEALKLFKNNLDQVINKMRSIDYHAFFVYKNELIPYKKDSSIRFENLFFKPSNN